MKKLIVFACLAVLLSTLPLRGQGIRASGEEDAFQTESGALKNGATLLKGAIIGVVNEKLKLVFGFFGIEKGFGLPLKKDLVATSRQEPLPDGRKAEITLVRETGTKRWIATNGVLARDGDDEMLVEGHTVYIVGGRDNPVRICGKDFSDSTVIIENGRAVLKAAKK